MRTIILIPLLTVSLFLFAQEQKNDSVFIKYDNFFLKRLQNPITKKFYYKIRDLDKIEEVVYFEEKRIYPKFKTKSKKLCFKKLLRKSKSYNKKKLKDYMFYNYLLKNYGSNSKYFIVKNKSLIEVSLVITVYD